MPQQTEQQLPCSAVLGADVMTLLALSRGISRGRILPAKLESARIVHIDMMRHCQLRGGSVSWRAHAPGFLLEVKQLWWLAEKDNTQDQQVYQAALDVPKDCQTYKEHALLVGQSCIVCYAM